MEVLLKFKKRYNGELSRPGYETFHRPLPRTVKFSKEHKGNSTESHGLNITEKKKILRTSKYLLS